MKTRVKTVPLEDLEVGQWFYYTAKKAAGVRRVVGYPPIVIREDGSMGGRVGEIRLANLQGTLPVEGPHVTYDEALEQAIEIEVPEPVPGTRFRWEDEDEVGVVVEVQWGMGRPNTVYAYYEVGNNVCGTCTRDEWEGLVHGEDFGRIIIVSTPDE